MDACTIKNSNDREIAGKWSTSDGPAAHFVDRDDCRAHFIPNFSSLKWLISVYLVIVAMFMWHWFLVQ